MEVKNREDIVLPVKMVPTIEIMPNMATTDAHHSAVIVSKPLDDGTEVDILVNTCSDSYGLLPIANFINPFEEAAKIKSVIYRSNISRFEISYILEDTFKVGRKVYNYLVKVVHSYDGSTSFKTFFGFVDSDEVEYFGVQGFDLNITHTDSAVDDMIEKTIELTLEGQAPIFNLAKTMNEKKITPANALEIVLPMFGIEKEDESKVATWTGELEGVKNYLDLYKVLMERLTGLTSLAKLGLAKRITNALLVNF